MCLAHFIRSWNCFSGCVSAVVWCFGNHVEVGKMVILCDLLFYVNVYLDVISLVDILTLLTCAWCQLCCEDLLQYTCDLLSTLLDWLRIMVWDSLSINCRRDVDEQQPKQLIVQSRLFQAPRLGCGRRHLLQKILFHGQRPEGCWTTFFWGNECNMIYCNKELHHYMKLY